MTAEPHNEQTPAQLTPLTNPFEAAQRQRRLLLQILRAAFLVLILTVTLLNIIQVSDSPTATEKSIELATNWWIPLSAAIALAALFLAADILTPNKKLQTIGGVMFGLIAGLIASLAFGFVIDLVATTWEFGESTIVGVTKLIVGISLCYLAITTVLQTQDDFRLVIPYVEFAKQIRGVRPLLLDSSALIDARIADLGETGLIQSPVVIPGFVIDELQQLADSAEKMKRAKGRRGLEVVTRLQRSVKLDVSIDQTVVPGKAVDQMLVELARQMPGVIVTSDVALARIAGFQKIPVLNLNDVANALRPAFVPGETLALTLVRKGEQEGQAVGFLEDGTMVVAEDGEPAIGTHVELTVRTSLQTSAGRLIFARLGDTEAELPARERQGAAHEDAEPAGPERAAPKRAPRPTPGEPPRTRTSARNPRR